MRKVQSEHTISKTVTYQATLHTNGDIDFDPCPYCGNTDLFNARVTYGSQYCVDGRRDGSLAYDDMGAEKIEYIRCGNMECGESLYSCD